MDGLEHHLLQITSIRDIYLLYNINVDGNMISP